MEETGAREISSPPPRPRAPSPSSPAIETSEASYEDLEDELSEDELQALESIPAAPALPTFGASASQDETPPAQNGPPASDENPEPEAAAQEEGPAQEEAEAPVPEDVTAEPSDSLSTAQSSTAEVAHEPEFDSDIDLETDEPAPVQEIDPEPISEPGEALEEVETIEAAAAQAPAPVAPSNPPAPEMPDIPPAERKPPPPRRSAKPSLPRAQQPRKKPWWETLFGDDFSRAYRPMTEKQLAREVDFIVESLALPKGSVILDLGCGQGEICVELARRGYSVVGYDLSVYQLAMAGDHAQAAKQKINFLQGDMREMAFEQMFDAVICWDTSFGYFEEEKNTDVLQRIRTALKPGGRFLLDVMNRDFAAREAPYNHWFEGDGCVCMDDMVMDWITNRLKVKRSIILDDGRSKELQYSVRLYGLSDVGRMLHDVGFRVSAVSGDVATKGAFFGPHSRRIIIQSAAP